MALNDDSTAQFVHYNLCTYLPKYKKIFGENIEVSKCIDIF